MLGLVSTAWSRNWPRNRFHVGDVWWYLGLGREETPDHPHHVDQAVGRRRRRARWGSRGWTDRAPVTCWYIPTTAASASKRRCSRGWRSGTGLRPLPAGAHLRWRPAATVTPTGGRCWRRAASGSTTAWTAGRSTGGHWTRWSRTRRRMGSWCARWPVSTRPPPARWSSARRSHNLDFDMPGRPAGGRAPAAETRRNRAADAHLPQHNEAAGIPPRAGHRGAVAENGDFAACCTCWLDAENRVGEFEPVGCHPDYRQRGLTRAAMFEAMRRLRLLGAEAAVP